MRLLTGEAYDKSARLLGLAMTPNFGAALEALALEGDPKKFAFTPPLLKRSCANFSYAGLKTAVRLAVEAEAPGPATEENRQVRTDIHGGQITRRQGHQHANGALLVHLLNMPQRFARLWDM